MMRFTILALLFTLSASASSPEYLVGGAVPTAATRLRFQPAVASDGTDYFAVWSDGRSGSGSIIGTRVTREGQILDPLGIRIGAATGSVSEPQVAWDGAAYLVVWTAAERRDVYDTSVHAARIAPDGRVVMQPRVIAADGMTNAGRYLASNGNVSVIVYQTDHAHLRIAVLDRDGNTLRDEVLADTGTYDEEPAIAAGTMGFVVAWNANAGFSTAGETIMAVPLTATGHVSGTPVVVGQGEHPAVGTDGTRFTITSLRNLEWQEWILVSRTFDASLTAIGGEHELLRTRQINHASVLWTGDRYEVVTARRGWTGGVNEIVSIELDRDGNPQPPLRSRGEAQGETFQLRIAAATNGDDVLLLRPIQGEPRVGMQMFAQLYPGNAATSSPPALLSWSGNAHRDPSIAASAFGHLVAWVEDGGMYATRVDRNGHSLDGRGIHLSGFYYGFVRAAFDGTNYVVAWRDGKFIGLRFIAPLTGATVAEAKIATDGVPELALAASPEATYLAYAEERVRVVRIPHATRRPDPVPLDVSPENMDADHPAAAWNGSTLLVTWNEQSRVDGDPPATFSIRIHAARVTPGLSLLDPAPMLVAEANEENEEYSFGPASVASNGTDWLVVASLDFTHVVARRVLENGTVRGNAPVKIGEGLHPVAAWDGTRYAVAWKEGESTDSERPLVLAAVPEHGALAVVSRVLVTSRTASGFFQGRPSIASAGSGETAVAYTKVSHLPEHAGVERSFFRVMDFNQRGRVIRR